MAAKMVSLRLDEGLLEWAGSYAKERGVSRTAVLEEAVRSFKADAAGGVPIIRQRVEAAERAAGGVGSCPKNEGGHVWAAPAVDPRRRCVHCSKPGRGDSAKNEGGNLSEAASARAALFAGLKAPMVNGSGKAPGSS